MQLHPRRIGAVAIAIAALGAVACSSSSRVAPTTTAPPTSASVTAPVTTAPVPSTATTAPAATIDLRVYFMRGDKIDVTHRAVAATQQVATAAMRELLSGPTPAETATGLATTVPAGSRLLGIAISNGVATVDLSGAFESGGGSLSMLGRLAQVTYTLTQFPTVSSVVFHIDGKPVSAFGGEGIVLDHPATRASFESVVPAILVESPGRGSAVSSPLRITGTANVFEAQFQAELTDSTGTVIATQSVHATSGTGTRGTFDSNLAFSSTGSAVLKVFDISPKDGSRVDEVQIPLNLTP